MCDPCRSTFLVPRSLEHGELGTKNGERGTGNRERRQMSTTVNRTGHAWLGAVLVLVSWQSAPAAAQEPETPTRTSLIEQAQAEKAARASAVHAGGCGKVSGLRRELPAERPVDLASVLPERVFRRRLHAGRRVLEARRLLQHPGHARQHHALRLQADRGAVPRAGVVRTAGDPVAARRLARGDPGRLLRRWQ